MATGVSSSVSGEFGPTIDDNLRRKVKEHLSGHFHGDFIDPSHADYPARSVVWNAMVSKKPGLVLRCKSTADVVAAVNAARANGLYPSVRCGGHQVAGKGLSDGGLTIDLSGMRNVTIDKEKGLAHVDGGCLLGDVDKACGPAAMVVPAGIMSETGVAGLSLGGGIGWFSRKHGLTCDNFHSLEVVTASGEVLQVDAKSHPDLFWALRGGGGNFGIVTKFTYKAYPFGPNMRIGISLFDAEHATAALQEYNKIYPTLPRHVGWHIAMKPMMPKLPFVPDELVGKRIVMVIAMWLGDAEDPASIEMIDKLGSISKPLVKASRVMPFGAGVQKMIDEDFGDNHRYYTKEAHVVALPDEVVDRLVEFWKVMPMDGEIEIIGLGGAITDVAEADSAFANRNYNMWLNFAMRWDDAKDDAAYMGMTRECVRSLEPWIGRGVYVNMLNADENDRIVEAYGGPEKFVRLSRIKGQYDPQNLFRINANIPPAKNDA